MGGADLAEDLVREDAPQAEPSAHHPLEVLVVAQGPHHQAQQHHGRINVALDLRAKAGTSNMRKPTGSFELQAPGQAMAAVKLLQLASLPESQACSQPTPATALMLLAPASRRLE